MASVFVVFRANKLYELVKSQEAPVIVIPVKTGIQENQLLIDSRFRGMTALETFYETIKLGDVLFENLNPTLVLCQVVALAIPMPNRQKSLKVYPFQSVISYNQEMS